MLLECPRCQFNNSEDSNFCSNCAASLTPSGDESVVRTKTLDTPLKVLLRGMRIADRYEVIELLGSGGMGKVYRVEDTKIDEEVALKIIQPEIAGAKRNILRFRNELKLARKIVHKNVCRMFDLGEDEGRLFITMEYVRGENLKSFLRRSKRLDIGTAIALAKQVGEGLAEAHRLGVVHRDLKSNNIMIDRNGNARIMDFGIAVSPESKKITGEGLAVGTPEYMSPEQVRGELLDQKTDLYSFGIILFELLTGRVPFEGDTSLDIALKHKTEPPPDPRNFNPQIPQPFSQVVLKCLEKDKEKRYQTAGEVISDLDRVEQRIPTKYRRLKDAQPGTRPKFAMLKSLALPGILALLTIVLIGYVIRDRFFHAAQLKWTNSIAVLPFEDRSGAGEQEALSVEMAWAVISKLSSCEGLRVIPMRTLSLISFQEKSNKEIGSELSVEMILIPYFKIEGESITVTAELVLVDAGQEDLLYTFNYDGLIKNAFEIQDRLAMDTADKIGVRLNPEKLSEFKRREPESMEAYKKYSSGNNYFRHYQATNDEAAFEEAVRKFNEAIEIENGFALAYWGLGNAYHAHFFNSGLPADFASMEDFYTKAYVLAPYLAEANAGLGWVHFYREDWEEAFAYYKESLALEPMNPDVNYYTAGFFRDIGLYQKAIELYRKAIAIDPVFKEYRNNCARCYMKIGEFDKAADLLEETLELDSEDHSLRLLYARQFIMMGKYGRAEEEIARVEKAAPGLPGIEYTRAYIYAVNGEREKALDVVGDLDRYFFTQLISAVYSLLGMKNEAIGNIRDLIENGFYRLRTYSYPYQALARNPFFDSLRGDKSFREIVKKEKKKYRNNLKKYSDI